MADPHSPPTTSPSVSVHPPSNLPRSTNPSSSSQSHNHSTTTRSSDKSVTAPQRLAELKALHLVDVQLLPMLHDGVVHDQLMNTDMLIAFDYANHGMQQELQDVYTSEHVYDILHHRHPTLVSHSTRPQITLLACAMFYVRQIVDLVTNQSSESSWSDVITLLANHLVRIVDNAFLGENWVVNNPDSAVRGHPIPLCVEKEYHALHYQTNILGLAVTHGTKADFSFGISKYRFQVFNQSSMEFMEVETLFGRQGDGIYLRLDKNPFEMIFPFFFVEIKGYSKPRANGSQQVHKDGRPQAYQAMMSGLVLYEHMQNLASIRSPVEYQQWEDETSIEDRQMMKRSYGVVTHQSTWHFFVMVLYTDTNVENENIRQYQYTQIAQMNVSDMEQLHRFLEIMRIALSEVFQRKRMLQRLLSMLTVPTFGGQQSDTPSGRTTVPTSSFSVSPYPQAGIQHSLATPSGNTNPSAVLGGTTGATFTGHAPMPWLNVDDPKRRKKLLIGWWENGGREWSLQGPTAQQPPTLMHPITSPPISPVSCNGMRSSTNIAPKPRATYDLTQHDDDSREHPATTVTY